MARGQIVETEELVKVIEGGIQAAIKQSAPSTPTTISQPPQDMIVGETLHSSLDDAATSLIRMLSPSIRDYALELADVTLKIPRWQLVLGTMMAQYESGTLNNPSIDPSWRQVEAIIGKSKCETCGIEYIPKRFGQKYCSNKCGTAARQKEIEERNRKRDEIEKKRAELMRESRLPRSTVEGLV